jgi:glycosyltransferase involved in cell wall biosynthesis
MEELKKVLVLSYFFTPCNLTASQRSLGWAKYLNKFGYYPIIITRNWDRQINNPEDIHHPSGKDIVHEQYDTHAVYYLPYKGNLRDKLYTKYGKNRYKYLRKALSFIELFGLHFKVSFIPFSNIYHFADQYLSNHQEIKSLIVTGNPFEIFRFGYLLNKKHQISWIADYRDDWNTSIVAHSRGPLEGLLKKLEIRSEKKYISTAYCITSVSEVYTNKIADFNGVDGEVLLNGFFPEDYINFLNLPFYQEFTVVYNGMLYQSQSIEVFLDAFKKLADKFPEHRSHIKLRFPGILFLAEVADRVRNHMKGYEDMLIMTPRISRNEVLEIQAKAHVLLMVSHKDAKGIPSSKVYEYLGLGKPVMICPGDGDILDQTFNPYNLGSISNTVDEAFDQLKQHFSLYLRSESGSQIPDRNYTDQFTREHQSGVLANLLNQLEHSSQTRK